MDSFRCTEMTQKREKSAEGSRIDGTNVRCTTGNKAIECYCFLSPSALPVDGSNTRVLKRFYIIPLMYNPRKVLFSGLFGQEPTKVCNLIQTCIAYIS